MVDLERGRAAIQEGHETALHLQALVDRTQGDLVKSSAEVKSQKEAISRLEAEKAFLNTTVSKLHSADNREFTFNLQRCLANSKPSRRKGTGQGSPRRTCCLAGPADSH